MIEIIIFKFVSNLEYVHAILDEQHIPNSIDIENIVLYSDNVYKSRIIEIIDQLNLDENEVEVDENFQKDFDDWHKNSLNPGHFLGGRSPSFEKNHDNYLMYGFITLVSGLACLIEILNRKNFSRNLFWISTVLMLGIAGSMFYQYYKFKKEK